MDKHYWTLESWGSDTPPANAEEIISEANALIDEFCEREPYCGEDEIEYFSEQLWEHYCMNGEFPNLDEEEEEQDEDEFRQLPSTAVDTYAEDEWRLDVVKHDDGSAEGWLYVEGAEVKMHTLTDDEETVINSFVAGEYRNQYTKEFIEEE